jgi:hypothetical protein
MKYLPAFNIWSVPRELLAHAQPGQWVYAGDKGTMGRFWGIKKTGSVVVGWHNNARNSGDYKGYNKALRDYGQGR